MKNNKELTSILNDEIANYQDIPFIPTDVEEAKEYINQISHYILCLYKHFINDQKVVVIITGIKVFFDIRVPNNANIPKFWSKIKNILITRKDNKRDTLNMSLF